MYEKKNVIKINRPPRSVPFSLFLNVLFGGVVQQIGWGVFAVGMVIFWIFVMNCEILYINTFRGELEKTEGKIISVRETSISENKHIIHEYRYEFFVKNQRYEGIVYTPGKKMEEGDCVTVEYSHVNPSISRIPGTRKAHFSSGIAFLSIFALIGLLLILIGLKTGWKRNYLLKYGEEGLGKLKQKEPTNTIINGRRVYELTFEFVAQDGKTYKFQESSHTPEILEDDAEEQILYDPFHPEYAVAVHNLPGNPRIDEEGFFRVNSLWKTLLILILPTITLVGNGLYIYFAFLVK